MLRSNKIISSKNFQLKMLLILFLFSFSKSWGQTTIFSENFGNPSANTSVNTYIGYQNNGVLTFTAGSSGTDVRTSSASSGYGTASGQGNVFLNSNTKFIEISGINTSACSSLTLSMGVRKGANATTQPIIVQVSSDGVSYTTLTYANLSTSSNGWFYITLSGTIPSTTNLRIKIIGNDGANDTRIDDVILSGNCSTCTAPTTTITPTTQTVCAGAVTTISVSSSAASNTYTWQASATSGGIYSNVSNSTPAGTSYLGINTAVLTLTAGSTYYYRCLVTDVSGSCTATSGTSTLVVNSAPTITTQTTPSSTLVCAGTATSFSVGATGTNLTYQWQVSTGGAFSNATGGAYTTETTNKLNIGTGQAVGSYTFQCIINNSCGTLTSTPVTLTVASVPAMPVTPSIITTCAPAVISETVVGTPPVGVTWYWETSSTATSTTSPASVDYTLAATGNVFVRALNASGCWNNTPTTSSVVISVINPPSITTPPSSSVVCQGNSASIKVTMSASSSTVLTYQWQENTGSGFTNISNGSPYTISIGTYTSTLGIDGTKPVGTYTYQCIISNSCGTVTTSIVSVSVNVTPANDQCTNASTIVIDGGSVVGNLNCASPTAGLSYNPSKNDVWYVFTPTCTATHTVTMTFVTSGADYDVDVFNTASCPSSGSATFTSHGTSTVETISQTFTSGVNYYIRVLDYNTSGGTFSISVASSCGPPRTVTFDSNGGSGTMSNQTSGSATNLTSNAFTNSGCFFVAWNTVADGSGTTYANGSVYSFTADITLYAQWNCSGGSSFSCSGAVGNGKVQGCGDTSPCDLSTIGTYLDGVSCGTTLNTSCTGACDVQAAYSKQISVPAGCTATVIAEMKVRPGGCSNSGMDSGDLLAITNSGGTVISQTGTLSNGGTVTGSSINKNSGTGNADGWVQMVITGGVVTVSGSGQRGDEIVTYTVNFSGACGAGCNTILPITLLDFYGVQKNNKNELVWKVAEEDNIKRYVIEKSSDGVNFEHMIGVYPTPGNYDKTYRTEDLKPYDGITYYRLATMENDYSVQYYKIISMTDSNKKNWGYYYYQSDNSLNVEFKNALPEGALMSLYDMSGQTIVEKIITSTETKISTSNLSSGVYFVRITTPYKTENFKIIIQK